jgi:hypothetical protein
LNTAGAAGQADLVGFNNLYSNPGGTGFCAGGGPNVRWAFNIASAPISTSVTISLDGTKAAFVVNSNPPVLHVLTMGADGGTITSPITPAGGSDLTLTLSSSSGVSNSSIFVDYGNDVGYVGDDGGNLYKVSPLFGGAPALSGSWSTNPVAAGLTVLTSPVVDIVTGVVMVGSRDGNLYAFSTSNGAAVANSPSLLATSSGVNCTSGPCQGGIQAPPVLDVGNGFVYVGYAMDSANNANSGVAQLAYIAAGLEPTPDRLSMGPANQIEITKGAFNDDYFVSPTNTTWAYLACGTQDAATATVMYVVTFDTNRRINGRTGVFSFSNNDQCSPITEFPSPFSRTVAPTHDYILWSVQNEQIVYSFDIKAPISGTNPAIGLVPGGTSGIIIDNDSGLAEASSAYFTSLSAGGCSDGAGICAYKVHQSDLQ